jgi:aldehyde:ferredoxin oxidoreductase
MDLDSLVKAGERIFQLMRIATCMYGVTAADDQLPEMAMRPIADCGQEGHVPNMVKMLPEYYAIREWDSVSGRPYKTHMEKLGIGDLAGR